MFKKYFPRKNIVAVIVFLIFLLIIVIQYLPFINNFLFPHDDAKFLIYGRNILKNYLWAFKPNIDSHFYRPLFGLSFALAYYFIGTNYFLYHCLSIFLFSLLCLNIYFFYTLIFNNFQNKSLLSILGTFFFINYFPHSETVGIFSAIFKIYEAIFFINTLYFYYLFIIYKNYKYFYISILVFILSLLFSELSFLLPLFLILMQMIFNKKKNYSFLFFLIITFFYAMFYINVMPEALNNFNFTQIFYLFFKFFKEMLTAIIGVTFLYGREYLYLYNFRYLYYLYILFILLVVYLLPVFYKIKINSEETKIILFFLLFLIIMFIFYGIFIKHFSYRYLTLPYFAFSAILALISGKVFNIIKNKNSGYLFLFCFFLIQTNRINSWDKGYELASLPLKKIILYLKDKPSKNISLYLINFPEKLVSGYSPIMQDNLKFFYPDLNVKTYFLKLNAMRPIKTKNAYFLIFFNGDIYDISKSFRRVYLQKYY